MSQQLANSTKIKSAQMAENPLKPHSVLGEKPLMQNAIKLVVIKFSQTRPQLVHLESTIFVCESRRVPLMKLQPKSRSKQKFHLHFCGWWNFYVQLQWPLPQQVQLQQMQRQQLALRVPQSICDWLRFAV